LWLVPPILEGIGALTIGDMTLENDTHSFVVRIWHEAVDKKGNFVVWRGSIDHVGSGRRLYFDDLDGIVRFIREVIGVNVGNSRLRFKLLIDRIKHGFE
jgi:hypothetical protein